MSFCESCGQAAISTRFRSTAAILGALVLSAMATTDSWAQSTVVIGGSGQPAVEVNLEVLDRQEGQYPGTGRRLLMPGERPADVVRLRAPGASRQGSRVASSPRLNLRPPAAPPKARRLQQAAQPLPASPTPMVTQRVVSAPTPPQPAARTTRLVPPPRPAPMTAPLVVEKPASPPAKALAPRQMAAKSAPSNATPPPPTPPVAKASPPPRPTAKVPPPAAASALPKAPPAIVARAQPKPSQPATQPRREERQVASLPRVSLPRDGGQVLRIDFLGASTRLTSEAERGLGSLAATMAESDGRLQLKAYAGGTGDTLSSARRLSLSRALSVRSFLIEQGIRSTRIDVRALGRAEGSGPPERVDVVLLTQ